MSEVSTSEAYDALLKAAAELFSLVKSRDEDYYLDQAMDQLKEYTSRCTMKLKESTQVRQRLQDQPLFCQMFEMTIKECMASLSQFDYRVNWTKEEKLANLPKLRRVASMSYQAFLGLVHLERKTELDCPICTYQLPEVGTMSCSDCYSLLCGTCELKVRGKCPMCRSLQGFDFSAFIDILVRSRRVHSSSSAEE